MARFLLKELRSRIAMMLGWGVGLAVWGLLVLLIFPSMADQFAAMDLPEFYEVFGVGEGAQLGTLEGFVTVEMTNFVGPIVLGIVAVVMGGATLAGEEDSGTLETLLALPLPRYRIVLAKGAALALAFLLILLIMFLGTWGGLLMIQDQVETDLTAVDLLTGALAPWPLLMFFLTLSMWLGAYLPTRGHATAIGTALLIASYMIEGLGAISEKIEPLRPYVPHHYFTEMNALVDGWDATCVGVLFGGAVLFLILTLVSFGRRNVTVHAWPWQRPRPPVPRAPRSERAWFVWPWLRRGAAQDRARHWPFRR